MDDCELPVYRHTFMKVTPPFLIIRFKTKEDDFVWFLQALNACSVLSKSAATKRSSSMMNVPADYKVKGLASESGYVSKITSQYSQNVSDDAEVTRSASSWRSRTSYSYKWK